MMINKRLIGIVDESKKYIAFNVLLQWFGLLANIAMMFIFAFFLQGLWEGDLVSRDYLVLAGSAGVIILLRVVLSVSASRMSFLSSRTVKKVLREKIYTKLLKLGSSYQEKIQTSALVQMATEGVDQLESYFGSYLPQFFYALLAPITLFIVLSFISVPPALALLLCVPLIPIAIAAVQTWAKKLLGKYWGQYTALGDTFLENLQGLTTLKIYQTDGLKHK